MWYPGKPDPDDVGLRVCRIASHPIDSPPDSDELGSIPTEAPMEGKKGKGMKDEGNKYHTLPWLQLVYLLKSPPR
jgi:hypothetical protein